MVLRVEGRKGLGAEHLQFLLARTAGLSRVALSDRSKQCD